MAKIDPALVRKLIDYDPESGDMGWRERPLSMFTDTHQRNAWNARMAGKPAFAHIRADGYKVGAFFNKLYLAHHIAWAHTHCEWPDMLDHINHDRADNRLVNLRLADRPTNQKNLSFNRRNTSGRTGVTWAKNEQKWVAQIRHDKRHKNLGYFANFEDAVAAREAAEKRYGYHPNHGRVVPSSAAMIG